MLIDFEAPWTVLRKKTLVLSCLACAFHAGCIVYVGGRERAAEEPRGEGRAHERARAGFLSVLRISHRELVLRYQLDVR